jgi:hypothetical protein
MRRDGQMQQTCAPMWTEQDVSVRLNPDGSLSPGVMNFAITPATNPMMIVQMMLMAKFPDRG